MGGRDYWCGKVVGGLFSAAISSGVELAMIVEVISSSDNGGAREWQLFDSKVTHKFGGKQHGWSEHTP